MRSLYAVGVAAFVAFGRPGSAQSPAIVIDAASVATFGPATEVALFQRYGYRDVRLLAGGRVAASRRENGEVTVFAPNGLVERVVTVPSTTGARNLNLTGLSIVGGGAIEVFDVPQASTLRRSRFDAEGTHLSSEIVGTTDGPGAVLVGTLSDGTPVGLWTKLASIQPGVEVSDSNRIAAFTGDSALVVAARLGGIRRVGSPMHFSPHPVVAVLGDTIFYSNGIDGLVQGALADGSVVRSFRVQVDALTPEEAFARLEPKLGMQGQVPDVWSLPRGNVVPTIADLLPAPDGRIWAKIYDPATDSHSLARPRTGGEWLVLDTSGRVEARVAVPEGFRLMDIGTDRVAGILQDESGERVVTFRLTRVRPAA